MNLQRLPKDHLDLLAIWFAAPDHAKPALPFDGEELLTRIQLTHRWLLEHGGDKNVVQSMLITHYKVKGSPISHSTAQRYVAKAMEMFMSYTPSATRWYTDMLLMDALQQLQSAKRRGKDEAYARILKECRALMEKMDQYILEDQQRNIRNIAIEAVFSLEEADIIDEPDIRAKFSEWKRIRAARKSGKTLEEGRDYTIVHDPGPE